MCFDTGDLSSVPSFQTFRDHSGAFPTPARQARAARKHDQHLNPLPKNRPTTAILLLYFKPFFSDYLYSYVYLATQNYPGSSSSSRNAIPPLSVLLPVYKVGTPADVLFSFLLRLFDIVVVFSFGY